MYGEKKMSELVVELPRFVELRSQYSNKLLKYVKKEGEVKGFVQFSGDHVGAQTQKCNIWEAQDIRHAIGAPITTKHS